MSKGKFVGLGNVLSHEVIESIEAIMRANKEEEKKNINLEWEIEGKLFFRRRNPDALWEMKFKCPVEILKRNKKTKKGVGLRRGKNGRQKN